MWTSATRLMSFSGSAMVSPGGASPPVPLRGVLVQPYRFSFDGDGNAEFESLEFTDRTRGEAPGTGDFEFTDLPVTVEIDLIESDVPPFGTVEVLRTDSLPDLAFRLFIESEVLSGTGVESGTQFTDVWDERDVVTASWVTSHPERVDVALTGAPPLLVLAPDDAEAALALIDIIPPVAVPGQEFHFLRVGRVIRQELGELGDARPDYVGKPGYFTSSNRWVGSPPEPSFFPGHVDAPFGSTLQIGGHFGATFLTPPLSDNLYYHVDFSRYGGPIGSAFDPTHLVDTAEVVDPLFNKKYLLPHVVPPRGQWQTLHLGPFDGTITATEDPAEAGLVGSGVRVYKRPGLPVMADEYWPFWDLMVIWNSRAAPNELIVLTIEVYEKTGGTDTAPDLTKRVVTTSVNEHLPLVIDNRRPRPVFHWMGLGFAQFAPQVVSPDPVPALGDCGYMTVASPGPPGGNECLVVRYSIEDGSGMPHPHVRSYGLGVEYSPRGALHSAHVGLWGAGAHPVYDGTGGPYSYHDINGSYAATTPPVYTVLSQESVLVPRQPDGWPPEGSGDSHPAGPCTAYGAEVELGCSVRTVNGWGHIFGRPHVSRHIIIKV